MVKFLVPTTMIYTQPTEEDMAEAVETLAWNR